MSELNDCITLRLLVEKSHELAKQKGWWTGLNHNIPEKLALIHSEISEALEELRSGDGVAFRGIQPGNGKPEGFGIELADAVIRIADLCGYLGIDLEEAVRIKHQYNATRPYKHGKNF